MNIRIQEQNHFVSRHLAVRPNAILLHLETGILYDYVEKDREGNKTRKETNHKRQKNMHTRCKRNCSAHTRVMTNTENSLQTEIKALCDLTT